MLKNTRNISFEQVAEEIAAGRYSSPKMNPTHPHQFITVVMLNDYPCVVPFVKEDDGGWFLKTIYPSRKMKRKAMNEKNDGLLDAEEQWIEDHLDEFVPAPEWVGVKLQAAACNKVEELRGTKRQISINVDERVIAYFKDLATDTGIAYQSLINMFLLQCVMERRQPRFV